MYGQRQDEHYQCQGMMKVDHYYRIGIVKEEKQIWEVEEIVNLSGMSLNILPSFNIGTICKLNISNNNLLIIPESVIARLLNLMELDMHSNQLSSLPNSIGCLTKLKFLNVSGNLLQSLTKTIVYCRSLEELNANFNMLTVLPDTIGFELEKLKSISVNSNKLIYLPYSTSHLTNLQTLDARLNCLRSLPNDLENLINLQVLNISQNFNYLTTLPYSLGLLISLVELDVSYNNITALPDSVGCLRKLQKLSVEGNPLVSPPMEVVERGLQTVKGYLSEKMNGTYKESLKKSWIGKLAKLRTFNGRRVPFDQERKVVLESNINSVSSPASPNYRAVDAFTSLRYGMFSPKRLFTPKTILAKRVYNGNVMFRKSLLVEYGFIESLCLI